MVVRSNVQTPCSDETQPSTSQQVQQMRRQCRGQLSEVNIGRDKSDNGPTKTRTTYAAAREDKEDTVFEAEL